MSAIKLFISSIILSLVSIIGGHPANLEQPPSQPPVVETSTSTPTLPDTPQAPEVVQATSRERTAVSVPQAHTTLSTTTVRPVATGTWNGLHAYSDSELASMASNTYANGEVPLGDGKYTTSGPKKGYVYLCNAHKDNFGSDQNGPWIHGTTWNFLSKYTVSGSVSWPEAVFSNIISGAYRVLSGNDLPIDHATGKFPVSSSDKVYAYDRNPNSISAQSIKDTVPADPTYSATPYCMRGEAGIMLSGVALFDALDAPLRDAPAHEAQDSCGGHPQESGEYHYHSLSPCFKDISVRTVLGYAYDGFPITGPLVSKDRYLTTNDLDECHGIVSEIVQDGKKKTTYHYVMTQDYPYSVSCFRGKPSTTRPSVPQKQTTPSQSANMQNSGVGMAPSSQGGGMPPAPPQEAQDACDNLQEGDTCTVGGRMTGICATRGEYFACFPQ